MDNAKKINIPNECKELFAEFGAKMFNKLGFFEFGDCRCEELEKEAESHCKTHMICKKKIEEQKSELLRLRKALVKIRDGNIFNAEQIAREALQGNEEKDSCCIYSTRKPLDPYREICISIQYMTY